MLSNSTSTSKIHLCLQPVLSIPNYDEEGLDYLSDGDQRWSTTNPQPVTSNVVGLTNPLPEPLPTTSRAHVAPDVSENHIVGLVDQTQGNARRGRGRGRGRVASTVRHPRSVLKQNVAPRGRGLGRRIKTRGGQLRVQNVSEMNAEWKLQKITHDLQKIM